MGIVAAPTDRTHNAHYNRGRATGARDVRQGQWSDAIATALAEDVVPATREDFLAYIEGYVEAARQDRHLARWCASELIDAQAYARRRWGRGRFSGAQR